MARTRVKANQDIRKMIRDNDLFNYEIADYLGICEMTMCRRLRRELSPEDKKNIIKAIDILVGERCATAK